MEDHVCPWRHAYLFDNENSNPQATAPDTCACEDPAVCSYADGKLAIEGPGDSQVTLSAGGHERSFDVTALTLSEVLFSLDDQTLNAIEGWNSLANLQ